MDREVYGAFVIGGRGITVLEASAASPTVAQLLTTVGQRLASHAQAHAARRPTGRGGTGEGGRPGADVR